MDSLRKTALVAGAPYVITFISIPTLVLYGPVLSDPNYIVGPGPDTPVVIGGILGDRGPSRRRHRVALYPVVKRQNRAAPGFVGSRTLEGAAIIAGVVSLLYLCLSVRPGRSECGHRRGAGRPDLVLPLGQSLMPAASPLGSLLYRSCLVPRVLPVVDSSGRPCFVSDAAVLSACGPISAPSGLRHPYRALGVLAGRLIVKGFKPSPITAMTASPRSLGRLYRNAAGPPVPGRSGSTS
jgi:hypothetical protein